MNARTKDRVERWESRAFSGGYEGLRDLADSDFTGAVESGGTWLFMLNGRVVGVYEGSIEDFEDASGTAHVAPDPALPLLFAMWEEGGETQGKYYTEDTAVSEVDDTLTSGSFTGYLELSENVLSGDYYVVYYGGRSMSAAFVGNSEELVGGDDAFERADDEVGIYEVKDVDIDVIDIPEPEGDDERVPSSPEPSEQEPEAQSASSPQSHAPEDPAERGSADPDSASPRQDSGGRAAPSEPSGVGSSEDAAERSSASPESGVGQAIDDSVDTAAADADSSSAVDGVGDVPGGATGATDSSQPDTTVGGSATGANDQPNSPVSEDEMDSVFDRLKEQASNPNEPELDPQDPELSPTEMAADVADSDPAGTDAASVDTGPTGDPYADETDVASSGGDDTAERQSASTDSYAGAESTGASGVASTADSPGDAGGVERPSAGGGPSAGSEGASSPDPAEQDADEAARGDVMVIPSLDPDHSTTPESDDATAESGTGGTAARSADAGPATDTQSASAGTGQSPAATNVDQRANQQRTGPSTDEVEQRLEERDERIEKLENAVQRVRDERDQLRRERDQLESDNESLREEIAGLERQIEQLESQVRQLEEALEDAGKTAYDATTKLSPAQAIAATNLFVRYRSKGDATLAAARDGKADADEVNPNIRLETHTQFDAGDAAVDGEPFESFLEETLEYRFVRWIVETLLYEIRDTGHASGLQDLYEAIPEIDRAELGGDVDIVYTEDGEEITEQASFDVVLRDRMGNPLIVANLNDSRDPASESMLVELESAASKIKQVDEELAAGFLVTSSFFEPGALEAVAEATSGSLLSRDSRESFVKLTRKQGYHLCLVEARANDFHINVPEL